MSTRLLQLLELSRLPDVGERLRLREPMMSVSATAEEHKPLPGAIRYAFIAEFGTQVLVDAREVSRGALEHHLRYVRASVAQNVYGEVKEGLIAMFDALYRLRQASRDQEVFDISTELFEKVGALLAEIAP